MKAVPQMSALHAHKASPQFPPSQRKGNFSGMAPTEVTTTHSPRSRKFRAGRTTVIFDGDDTLWETQPLYEAAKELFFDKMGELGFALDPVKTHLDSIDRANVNVWGFSKKRFPQSMYDTYCTLCIERGVRFDPKVASSVRAIGESVFKTTPRIFDGTLQVLMDLRSGGTTILLATKGDPDVQEERIDSVGLRGWFDYIYVLLDKGVAEFQQIVREYDVEPESGWSVGNSLRSDIKPALAVGLNAIWIPNVSWSYEEDEAGTDLRLYRAHSIREVPGIIFGTRL